MARTPGARLGSRRADRRHDRLGSRVHAHPVRRVGRVLRLLPDPLPAIAASGGELHGGQVAHVELSRGRRGRGRSGSPVRIRDPALGREGRWHAPGERSAGRSASPPSSSPGTSTMPAPTGNSAARTSSCSTLQANPLGLDRSDPAAKDDVTTLNQLYLPVNKPIIVRLRSKDVIHSFGVPEFRVKQDAIPGLTIPIWFVPTVTTAEMRTRKGNRRVPVRDRLRAALRPGPCRDAGICHRPDRRGVPEVVDEKVKERGRGPVPVRTPRLQAVASSPRPSCHRRLGYRTSSASASARESARALRRSRGRGRSCGRTPRRP